MWKKEIWSKRTLGTEPGTYKWWAERELLLPLCFSVIRDKSLIPWSLQIVYNNLPSGRWLWESPGTKDEKANSVQIVIALANATYPDVMLFCIHALGYFGIQIYLMWKPPLPLAWGEFPVPGALFGRWLTLQASPWLWPPSSHPKRVWIDIPRVCGERQILETPCKKLGLEGKGN